MADRPERLVHCRRLQHSGPADEAPPLIRDLRPIGFGLGSYAHAPANDSTEGSNRGHPNVIGRTLEPIADVVDPRPKCLRHEPFAKRLDWRQFVWQGLRLEPLAFVRAIRLKFTASPSSAVSTVRLPMHNARAPPASGFFFCRIALHLSHSPFEVVTWP